MLGSKLEQFQSVEPLHGKPIQTCMPYLLLESLKLMFKEPSSASLHRFGWWIIFFIINKQLLAFIAVSLLVQHKIIHCYMELSVWSGYATKLGTKRKR